VCASRFCFKNFPRRFQTLFNFLTFTRLIAAMHPSFERIDIDHNFACCVSIAALTLRIHLWVRGANHLTPIMFKHCFQASAARLICLLSSKLSGIIIFLSFRNLFASGTTCWSFLVPSSSCQNFVSKLSHIAVVESLDLLFFSN